MKIVDSDEKTIDYNNPLFGTINGSPRCRIDLNVTPTKKRSKKKDGTENQYLLQGECKVYRKKTTHVCLDCADIYAVKNMTFSEKYIIIKSRFYIFMTSMQHYS